MNSVSALLTPSKDLDVLLADVPAGAWVALTNAEDRVLAFGDVLGDVIRVAKATGETDPFVVRKPLHRVAMAL